MAKITVAGDAVVVTSAMKLEDLRTIAKHRPKALILYGGEDGKEPVFAVAPTNGVGCINSVGAEFGAETRDDAKLAVVTMIATRVDGDVIDYVADQLGTALMNLNKLEATLPAVLDEINAELAAVKSAITIAQ
jgi:hypothetical protein